MAADTKWDVSDIEDMIRELSSEKEIIEDNKNFLISINSEVERAWQGYAGRSFDQRMDIDVQNTENVIKALTELISDLKSAAAQCYAACENDIDGKIRSLAAKI